MQILDRIEDQIAATKLPLVAITVAAVPCPDTPVILTLHWHGFIKEKLADIEEAEPVAYTSVPSSALQRNERWRDLVQLDRAGMDAAWELGAWDVARAERRAARGRARIRAWRSNACRRSARSRSASTAASRWSRMRRTRTICSRWQRAAAI